MINQIIEAAFPFIEINLLKIRCWFSRKVREHVINHIISRDEPGCGKPEAQNLRTEVAVRVVASRSVVKLVVIPDIEEFGKARRD